MLEKNEQDIASSSRSMKDTEYWCKGVARWRNGLDKQLKLFPE